MRSRTLPAALSGLLSVALAFGVGELLAAVSAAVPSPLDSIGQVLVPRFPPSVTSFAISTFGTANRAVLTAGTVAIGLAVGAWVGVAARRRFTRAVAIFAVFALLGIVAALDQPGAVFPLVVGASVLAAGSGLWALRAMLRRLPGTRPPTATDAVGTTAGDDPTSPDVRRRDFLVVAGGVGAAAVVTFGAGRVAFGAGRRGVEPTSPSLPRAARALPDLPAGGDLAERVEDVSSLFTPNDRFYRIDTQIGVPHIDAETWSLRILGLVQREVELGYSELLDLPLVEVDATLACVSNEVGGDLVGNARWLGVPLGRVLELAGVRDEAEQLVGRSGDGWTAGFPIELATDGRDALVAVGMNGESLPPRHGFPARLVVPGLYGYVSATKWITEIELATWDGIDGYWIPRGWAKQAPVKTASRIDVPIDRGRVPAGEVVVAGVAWAPARGIRTVELQADGGAWRQAQLNAPLADTSWVQWSAVVDLPEGMHQLVVRAVDGDGQLQPQGPRPPAPDGSEGWHTVVVDAV